MATTCSGAILEQLVRVRDSQTDDHQDYKMGTVHSTTNKTNRSPPPLKTNKLATTLDGPIKAVSKMTNKLVCDGLLGDSSISRSSNLTGCANNSRIKQDARSRQFRGEKEPTTNGEMGSKLLSPVMDDKTRFEEALKKRRQSFQNAEVFIYPPQYKDMNECQMCRRDKQICRCNNSSIAPTSNDDSSSNSALLDCENRELLSTQQITTDIQQQQSNDVDHQNENNFTCENKMKVEIKPKNVYKISISTASIDQKSNQIKLSTPKLILPKKSSSPISSPTSVSKQNLNSIMVQNDNIITFRQDGSKKKSSVNGPKSVKFLNLSDERDEEKRIDINGNVLKSNLNYNDDKCAQEHPDQLTCNISLGDEIKITSTTIQIGATPLRSSQQKLDELCALTGIIGTKDHSNTSIIPIQTISSRRKNIAPKLNRQAIHEDYDDGDDVLFNRVASTIDTVPCLSLGIPQNGSSCDVQGYSPIIETVRDFINNVNNEIQVNATAKSIETVNSSSPDDSSKSTKYPRDSQLEQVVPLSVSSLVVDSDSQLQTLGTIAQISNCSDQSNVSTKVHKVKLDSPKKSIFDGASKDEILEYLEDARERVPDILMAADDVMVINENELIVVNQLEPGSPATPISIVETDEVSETSSVVLPDRSNLQNHPIQLRQHLQQMYQTSHLPDSLIISNGNTLEDDMGLSSDTQSGSDSKQGSKFNSIDLACSSSGIRFASEDTCSSIDLISGGGFSVNQLQLDKVEDNVVCTSESSAIFNPSDIVIATSISSVVSDCQGIQARGRLDSSNGSSPVDPSALQIMMLHQRYSNRDSLSSSSSSPPSSASPTSSSSNSFNQTSGNCSAASTFYASSSLSCSSPLLATNSINSTSPAPNKLAIVSTKDYEDNNGVPYNAQLLDSLVKGVRICGQSPESSESNMPPVERDDSGLGSELISRGRDVYDSNRSSLELTKELTTSVIVSQAELNSNLSNRIIPIDETSAIQTYRSIIQSTLVKPVNRSSVAKLIPAKQSGFSNSISILSKNLHSHNTTMNRLNNYFLNRHPLSDSSEGRFEFQCLDCDQFIDVDPEAMFHKISGIRFLHESESQMDDINTEEQNKDKLLTPDQLDKAFIAAMNGLPLCKLCEKKRIERKEIISEFVDTELKYGRDLKIIHDEFYRPMQIAGLLSKDQINGVFLNLEELIMANCRFADRLETSIVEAQAMGDTDYYTVNIGRLFVESAEMLHTFESYCIRQGSSACLLARLAKEKELLRIFLRVSQMENTLLRRMNLAAFLMVPVQRVTKYPLLLSRLYKVTAYHHKDRETLRDAQLKIELHLEHINQQTKGVGATNKIWRRISNLSAPISNRRALMNADDIGYIKLRKTAMDLLKWDRDETQFIHSGKLNFTPLNEYLTKQKMKPLRYMAAHALLVVLGKPNWKYRPDRVKSILDNKLLTPTPGGNGIKDAALLLFREKNGRFVPCREPLFLSNCVLSNDCSQFNNECPLSQSSHNSKTFNQNGGGVSSSISGATKKLITDGRESSSSYNYQAKTGSVDLFPQSNSIDIRPTKSLNSKPCELTEQRINPMNGCSISSLTSLPEDQRLLPSPPPTHTSRSYSLASALPRTTITTASSITNLSRTTNLATTTTTTTTSSSNQTILEQLRTKVNSYHKTTTAGFKAPDQNGNKTTSFTATTTTTVPSLSSLTQIVDTSNQSAQLVESIASNRALTNTNVTTVAGSTNDFHQHYNHHFFHNHHQPYGDYEESFEIHERFSKESMLLRADTPLKTRYWLQMLRYHAKDLGHWRTRRNGLANIMMMRQE